MAACCGTHNPSLTPAVAKHQRMVGLVHSHCPWLHFWQRNPEAKCKASQVDIVLVTCQPKQADPKQKLHTLHPS